MVLWPLPCEFCRVWASTSKVINPLNTRLFCYWAVSETRLFYDVIVISCNQTRRSPGLVSEWSPKITEIYGARHKRVNEISVKFAWVFQYIYSFSSPADLWQKGSVSDKSTKICLLIVHYIPKHISYGPNLNFHFFIIGGHFPIWLPNLSVSTVVLVLWYQYRNTNQINHTYEPIKSK